VIGNVSAAVVAALLFIGLGIAAKRAAFDTIQWGATFHLAVLFLVSTRRPPFSPRSPR